MRVSRMKVLVCAASACLALLAPAFARAMGEQRMEWNGDSWRVEDIAGRGVIDNARTTLRVDADGKVSGSTGCNHFAGVARVSGGAISFGNLAVTMRACLPALADQERKFLDALKLARTARLDATGRLLIVSARGDTLLTLTKM